MPDDLRLLRFQCSLCDSALNLVAIDRTNGGFINIEFMCYDCLIESGISDPKDVVFTHVTGVRTVKKEEV
jgi:hypothetical protein